MFSFLRRKKTKPRAELDPRPNPAARRTALFQFEGPTMGTRYTVSCGISPQIDRVHLQQAAHAAVDLVDCQMSTWKPDSDLSRFNAASPGEWVPVPDDLAYVVASGLKLGRDTGGAFDMTVGAAVNLWGFGPMGTRQSAPDAQDAEMTRQTLGYTRLEARLDPPALRKTANCYVDLSGIAKGYGVSKIAQTLKDLGVSHYLVAIDGEIALKGRKPGPDPRWTVSIDAPIPGRKEAWDILQPPDGALATSGDYRHFFQDGDGIYSHTIDARTGRPVVNDIASVTVFHKDCMMADAWATALLVLGSKQGVAMAQARNIPALFLIRTPEGIDDAMTCGFEDFFGADPFLQRFDIL